MQSLVFLLCLLSATAAAATPLFHCSSDDPLTVASSLEDFRLTTTRVGHSTYSSDLTCEFNAESPNAAFLVEVESFKVSSAVLSISSGDQLLFRGSSMQKHQTSIVTPSKRLRIRFDAAGDRSNSGGVTMRVRALNVNGCPPGWTYLHGDCFGTSSTSGRLKFADAQRACNSMRANLLHLPRYYSKNVAELIKELPGRMAVSLTWIGLTDIAERRWLYWLDGDSLYRTFGIGCVSGGSYDDCQPRERCAAVIRDAFHVAYMEDCETHKSFICYSPYGGTDVFYPMPSDPNVQPRSNAWIWGVVVGCVLAVGLVAAGIVVAVRKNRVRRAAVTRAPTPAAGSPPHAATELG